MGIVNQKIETAGLAAVKPRFIYIETDDTQAEVKEDGYLNSLNEGGDSLRDSDIAVVKTKNPSRSDLYHVQKSGQNWNLVPLGGGAGGSAWLFDGSNIGNGTLESNGDVSIHSGQLLGLSSETNIVFENRDFANGKIDFIVGKDFDITGANTGIFNVDGFFSIQIDSAEIKIGTDPTSPAVYVGHANALFDVTSALLVFSGVLPTTDPPPGSTWKNLQIAIAGPTVGLVRYAP